MLVFERETWKNYDQVTNLPTGAQFPSWLTEPVADVTLPPTPGADWHLYFGTTTQMYFGVASVIHAIDEKFPDVNIGHDFYDAEGRLVLSVIFFGPRVGSDGGLISPGGIFVGTNLTPLMPTDGDANSTAERLVSSSMLSKIADPDFSEGNSYTRITHVTGKNSHRYMTRKSIRELTKRFVKANSNN